MPSTEGAAVTPAAPVNADTAAAAPATEPTAAVDVEQPVNGLPGSGTSTPRLQPPGSVAVPTVPGRMSLNPAAAGAPGGASPEEAPHSANTAALVNRSVLLQHVCSLTAAVMLQNVLTRSPVWKGPWRLQDAAASFTADMC